MGKYLVKKVDSDGKSIKNLLEWKKKHSNELYHDSKTNYLFYHELKNRGIEFEYQVTFELQPSFNTIDYVIRKREGKKVQGWFECKIQPITWSPDFLLTKYNLVIEAKGRIQETFPMKLKMFKYKVVKEQLGLKVVVLHTLKELQDFLDKGLPR